MQAGHRIGKGRTRACVPIALRFPQPLRKAGEDAGSEWEELCMVLCEVLSLKCLGLAGQVCDVKSWGKESGH